MRVLDERLQRAAERDSGGGAGATERAVDALAQQLQCGQLARRGGLEAPPHDALGIDEDERALGKAAGMQHAEGRARRALRLEVRELLDRSTVLIHKLLLPPL